MTVARAGTRTTAAPSPVPNLLRTAAAWLARTRTAHMADPVLYLRRGADVAAAIPLTMSKAKSEFADEDDEGIVTTLQTVDWIGLTADLAEGGVPFEPREGDRVIEGGLDAGDVYEVQAPAGVPCWKWADPLGRTERRVYSRRVGAMPNPDA